MGSLDCYSRNRHAYHPNQVAALDYHIDLERLAVSEAHGAASEHEKESFMKKSALIIGQFTRAENNVFTGKLETLAIAASLLRKPEAPDQPHEADPEEAAAGREAHMSEPCNAAMRGLPRSESSTITPITASSKPVIRLDFRIHYCDRSAVFVSPQQEMHA
jgi:hypothetical protein